MSKNPFLDENMSEGGGGLWDGKTVTILSAKAEIRQATKTDGTSFTQHVLSLVGIADDSERERREDYSAGLTAVPQGDGNGFTLPEGKGFFKTSNVAEFLRRLAKSGFDMSKLFDESTGKQNLSALAGTRFTFVGVERKDAQGNVKKSKSKKNDKEYIQYHFYPETFVGFKGGQTAAPKANGALREKATGVVTELLAGAENQTLTRANLVRNLATRLAGDADSNAIIALVVKDDFHAGQAWKRDGTTISLG